MTDEQREQLIEAARRARTHAYAPYSKFSVGAAVLTASGEIVRGCNVENASYGLTTCAERTAIFTAVAAGHTAFVGLAVATPGAHPPCGACRQVLAEFCDDLPVLLVDAEGLLPVRTTRLAELLPHRFQL
jgi:cytidine deaminase